MQTDIIISKSTPEIPDLSKDPSRSDRPERPPPTRDYSRLHQSAPTPQMLASMLPGVSKNPSQYSGPERPPTRDYSRLYPSDPTPEMLSSMLPGVSKDPSQSNRPERPPTRDYSRLYPSGLSKTKPQSPGDRQPVLTSEMFEDLIQAPDQPTLHSSPDGDISSLHRTEAMPEALAQLSGTLGTEVSGMRSPELLPSRGMVAKGQIGRAHV